MLRSRNLRSGDAGRARRLRIAFHALHLPGEPVTATRNRRNRRGPQQLAQRPDLHLQVVFLDDQARPDGVEQLVFRDDPLAPLDQSHQHVESTRTERGSASPDQELTRRRVDDGAVEFESCGRRAFRLFWHRAPLGAEALSVLQGHVVAKGVNDDPAMRRDSSLGAIFWPSEGTARSMWLTSLTGDSRCLCRHRPVASSERMSLLKGCSGTR